MMELTTLRFECTSCGNCCRIPHAELSEGRKSYVFVSLAEAERIAAYAGLSDTATTERDAKGRLSLRCWVHEDGQFACRFLNGNKCSVYEARPHQCRTFPFWPDHLKSREAWEAVPCEGIKR